MICHFYIQRSKELLEEQNVGRIRSQECGRGGEVIFCINRFSYFVENLKGFSSISHQFVTTTHCATLQIAMALHMYNNFTHNAKGKPNFNIFLVILF